MIESFIETTDVVLSIGGIIYNVIFLIPKLYASTSFNLFFSWIIYPFKHLLFTFFAFLFIN